MTAKTTEASIQSTLKAALETLGYTVLEVAKGRSAKAAGVWTGTTPGTPDILVSHEAWGMPVWIGIELKTPTGRVRPEQQALADKGLTVIARSVAEGLAQVQSKEVEILYYQSKAFEYGEAHVTEERVRKMGKMWKEFGGGK